VNAAPVRLRERISDPLVVCTSRSPIDRVLIDIGLAHAVGYYIVIVAEVKEDSGSPILNCATAQKDVTCAGLAIGIGG